jgi:hypothetical protein
MGACLSLANEHLRDDGGFTADSFIPAGSTAPLIRAIEPVPQPEPISVNWSGVLRDSLLFLSVEHSFRLATEAATRAPGSPIIKGHFRSIASLHGWADGDPFYVNYVGHPLHGAVAGFIWVQNDRRFLRAEFGKSHAYWKSRLRAMAFAWVYSTQFEIGPLSEASIGSIQSKFPQQGLVDHVITPTLGLAWMVGEDALDRHVIRWIEARSSNPYVRMLIRGGLNPARSMANLMRGSMPWRRDTREGVFGKHTYPFRADSSSYPSQPAPRNAPASTFDLAPLEISVTANVNSGSPVNSGLQCVGGGAEAAFRLSPDWQLVTEVSGCNQLGAAANISGDSLSYVAGPRWTPQARNRWHPYVQILLGGNKVTQEEISPERKSILSAANKKAGEPPPEHQAYTRAVDRNGFAVVAGTGLNLRLNRAAAVRIAGIDYVRSWAGEINGQRYGSGLQLRTGLTLQLGTW